MSRIGAPFAEIPQNMSAFGLSEETAFLKKMYKNDLVDTYANIRDQ